MKLTAEEIDIAKTAKGGWDRATLAAWGIGWPPPRGWRQMLIDGAQIPEPGKDGEPATSVRPSACPEAAILREVVMAVIEAGHGEVLSGIKAINDYYGYDLPTVADVIGDRPAHAVITGGISFDDKVYSFRCERTIKTAVTSGLKHMDKIEEVFAPVTIQTLDELLDFIVKEIESRGGDPTKIRMIDAATAIPNVKFSDEWPCWILNFDLR